jgi:kynurenine formamidase
MPRFFDLSMPIQEHPGDPHQTRIERLTPRAGADHVAGDPFFRPKDNRGQAPVHLITRQSFPDEEFLSYEKVSTSVHAGTHLDAPYHYGSMCEGKPARTIDQVPLEWCYGPGVALDMRHIPPGGVIRREDLVQGLKRASARVQPGTIVLLHTGCDSFAGTPAYYTEHPGVGVDALEWLLDEGVKVVGVDAFSFDRPFKAMVGDYMRDGHQSHLWPAHFLGRKREYLQIEGLANLGTLPQPTGFTLSCFPVKIAGAGAGWIRAVAIFPD